MNLHDGSALLRARILNAKSVIRDCNEQLQRLSTAAMVMNNLRGKVRIIVEDDFHTIELPPMDLQKAIDHGLRLYLYKMVESIGERRITAEREVQQATADLRTCQPEIDIEDYNTE